MGELGSALSASSYLRSRVLYRMQALWAARTSLERFNMAWKTSGLARVFSLLSDEAPFFKPLTDYFNLKPREAMTVGCRLSDGTRRLDPFVPVIKIKSNARKEWDQVALHGSCSPAEGLSEYPLPKLGEGQQIVAVSPNIRFRRGTAPCSHGWEHVHVEFPISASTAALCEKAKEDGPGVLALLTASVKARPNAKRNLGAMSKSLGYVVPLPASYAVRKLTAKKRAQDFLQARVNFGRLLEVFPEMIATTNPGLVLDRLALKVFFVTDE